MSAPILAVDGLQTQFITENGIIRAADDVSFYLEEGEMLGIVGESGAGKSVTARSILQLIDSPGEIVAGRISLNGQNLLDLTDQEMRDIRGNNIAMIPQDPLSALNPVLKVSTQIVETIRTHRDVDKKEAREMAIEAMKTVEIPDAESRIDDYPYQFSGGMRQRVLIAIALSCDPDVLIADEPTTALDVTTQAKILDLLNDLQTERGLAVLLVTHNLGVVAQTCDRVNVMYAGKIVEKADVETLFTQPTHPYTRALIDSIPDVRSEVDRLYSLSGAMPDLNDLPSGCNFADRCEYAVEACREGGDPVLDPVPDRGSKAACIRSHELDLSVPEVDADSISMSASPTEDAETILEVRELKKHFQAGEGVLGGISINRTNGWIPSLTRQRVKAVNGVSFEIKEGETLGLVGESGCGKSTVARTILNLEEPTEGEVYFKGAPLHEMNKSEIRNLRKDMQIIFQDPQSSLNPRKTVGQIIGRAIEKHDIATGNEKRERVKELLERVGLPPDNVDKYPHEFSGGQQQRIAIAHALAVEPSLLVCDEPVSALDVSVQAQILNLLNDIQNEFGLSYLFITHNIGVVRHISDRIAVMYLGKIAEIGATQQVFTPPYHPYTESLLSAVPDPDPDIKTERIFLEGDVPSPINPPSGCLFQTRCPKKIGDVCEREVPMLEEVEDISGHQIACHLSKEEMSESIVRKDEEMVTDDTADTSNRT